MLRLFILSGQSNMGKMDPAVSFTPALRRAFPQDEVLVVKSAKGGMPIRRWYQDWWPGSPMAEAWDPAGNGDLYDLLMEQVATALAGRRPDTLCFVWMQGERDAKTGQGAVYRDSLTGLIAQLRRDLGREDVRVVIGRLSRHGLGRFPDWEVVRQAQVAVAEADPLATWVDSDGLEEGGPDQGLHYTPENYTELGRRLAAAAIGRLG
jgi:hypothetical protein